MKKWIGEIFVFALFAFFLFSNVVCADTGPKPSVQIQFEGMGSEVYYVTLLSKADSVGPWSYENNAVNENSHFIDENHKQEDVDAWETFVNYKDSDGFYFLGYFSRNDKQNDFSWNYYPPDTFKVLIYIPENHSFITSDIYSKYAFDSYYKTTVPKNAQTVKNTTAASILKLEKSYDYNIEILSLIVRVLLTIGIELLIAFPFGLWKKNIIWFILVVNVVTQLLLNVGLNIVNYYYGCMSFAIVYFLAEFWVVIIEMLAYLLYFRMIRHKQKVKLWIAPVYALVANVASFVIGMIVAVVLPAMF